MSRSYLRRDFLSFPLGAAMRAAAAQRRSAPRPNVVFILIDDLRFDELHCTGHPFVRTPNIDRIAAEGMMFRNAFVTTPLCSPSRTSFLTGQYAHTHGIIDNTDRSARSQELITFPLLMHRTGYETAFIGKWHMGVDDSPRPGFDRWISFKGQGTYNNPDLDVDGKHVKCSGYVTDIFTDYALDFVSARHDKPFLLFLAHKAVHPEIVQSADGSVSDPNGGRFIPAERHKSLYASARFPRRPNALSGPHGKPALERSIPGLSPLGPKTGTDDETVRDRARMLQAVDEGLGRMFQALERTGRLDKTVLVFTSDQGYFFGEHGLSYERRLAYEESIRIPMLIRYPRLIRPDSSSDAFALNIDMAPTLLEMAGLVPTPAMQGRSLRPLFHGTPADWRRSFLVEYYSDTVLPRVRNMGYKCLRTNRWKYIHCLELEGMDELYDLRSDPYEMKNLAGDAGAQRALHAAQQELRSLLAATGCRLGG